ncbi:MAG: M28 family peptidase [Candidatus Lernaella stagnicola]|nr:M28 family peptidase [Candidatus Lernaella stagnicola]
MAKTKKKTPVRSRKKAAPRAISNEKKYAFELIDRVVRECPRRKPTSEDERQAQMIFRAEFEKLGLKTHEESFRFNDNLYANLALHFGLGTLGSAVSGVAPALGFLLHSTAAASYFAESTRRAYFLRRLFPWKPSQNLLATMPAEGDPDLRVVILGHADAAFTGFLFDPRNVKAFAKGPPLGLKFLERSLTFATQTQFALAGFDLLRCFFGPLTLPLRPVEAILSIPGLLAFLLNLQMVMRNEIVPGANDNLTGCAALPLLAQRLAPHKPKNVEYVFGVTGCEEASLGGADALARVKKGEWDRNKTVILGLDGLTNGTLRFFQGEGEIVRTPIPTWIKEVCEATAGSESRFNEVTGFDIPVGGSDVAAFLAHGYDGVCLGCVDPELGSPRHYHWPTDTPENLDMDQFMMSVEFAEKLVHQLTAFKLR